MLARVFEVKLTLLIFEKALCALSISKGTTLNLFIEHLNKGRFPVRDVCFVSACPCLLVRVRWEPLPLWFRTPLALIKWYLECTYLIDFNSV